MTDPGPLITRSAALWDRSPAQAAGAANDGLPRLEAVRENAGVVVLAFILATLFLIPTRLVFPSLGAAGRPFVIAGVALLVLWVLTLIVKGGLPPGPQPIRWVVLVYLGTQVAGYVSGYNRGLSELESNSADRSMITTLSVVGVVLCFADGPRNRRQIDLLLRILVGLGVFSAMVGAAQFFVRFDLQQHIQIPGLRPHRALIEIGERGTGGVVARVAGMTSHYIEFGVVLAVLTPVAIHFALYERDPKKRLTRWVFVAAIAGVIPFSVSRSGIVALSVGLLLLAVVWSWRLRYGALVIGILSLVLFRAVNPGVLGTLRALFVNADRDPSVQARTDDYDIVAPLIYDHLWTGLGAGTFLPERYLILDNQLLGTLVSSGVVGLIGLLGLFIGGIGMARSIRRRAKADEDRHLAEALFASIAACLVVSLTFDSLTFVQFTGLLSVLLGAVGALWRTSGTSVANPAVTEEVSNGQVMRPLWPDLGWVQR